MEEQPFAFPALGDDRRAPGVIYEDGAMRFVQRRNIAKHATQAEALDMTKFHLEALAILRNKGGQDCLRIFTSRAGVEL